MDSPSIVLDPALHCGVDTVPAARQVSFAPAGVRIRQWPARLASRGPATRRPGRRAALAAGASFSHHAQGGGIRPDGAGNLTDDPELRHTEAGIARARFRVAVRARKEQEASFFTKIVWHDQAEHVAESLTRGSWVVAVGRLQQRAWTAEDGSAHSGGRGACDGGGRVTPTSLLGSQVKAPG